MKKYLIVFAAALLSVSVSHAGMVQPLQNTYVSSNPTFNDVEYISIEFLYSSSVNHRAIIKYYEVDEAGNRISDLKYREVYDRSDNPDTDPASCVAENDPYDCCTGEYPTDANAGCNEAVTDFSDYTAGFLTTLNARTKIAVEQKIATEYDQYVP